MIIDRPTPATQNGLENAIRGWPTWMSCKAFKKHKLCSSWSSFTMFHYVSLCFTMFHYVSLCFTVFFDQVEATQRQCFSGIDGLTRRITSSEHNEDTSLHPAMSNNDDAVRREYWLSSCWSSAPLTFLGELHDCLILLVKYPFIRIYLLLVVSHVSMFSHICDDETQ